MYHVKSDFTYPKMYRIRQHLNQEKLMDLRKTVFDELDSIGIDKKIKKDGEIAVCAGSRGINNIDKIVKAAVDYVFEHGGKPFIVPAMGSHGGATAEGQIHVLEKFGISEKIMGCEIRSDMEPVYIGKAENGAPVYFDKNAYGSAGIIVVNRVKPHTDFLAKNESGVVKMCAVGLGKQKGATAMHGYGLGETIPLSFKVSLKKAPYLAGLAIIENSVDETYIIKALKPENFLEEEAKLLEIAKQQVPHLPVDKLDILIVKEMGKMFSGTGVDTKVVGRIKVRGVPEPSSPDINKLAILRLSPDSYGNAVGIGLADLTTQKLVDMIDYEAMYINLMPTTYLERGKVPAHFATEKETIAAAFKTLGIIKPEEAKVIVCENTLNISRLLVSEAVYKEIKDNVDLLDEDVKWTFDENEDVTMMC
ncbi:MAG: DUF362 domain-containing protein [Clostridia bacterium]|jgi:hypothetical protein|nr:DUF362 domain-containing protein [Clostridia bacterium]MCI2000534.1 DUF362 domain-containing protein [Clostridia bacterium]MCI2014989.1 DUF362 domain-containing protein [Clostridia bacterium]